MFMVIIMYCDDDDDDDDDATTTDDDVFTSACLRYELYDPNDVPRQT